ncbi:protease complex subunit PrcB family protein [uncultured Flavobacterium sp.]|uniref:protease complex subunit PrcB family protein n=1 Tax=uncultured Flavobacterium sp. TaxID=165435 RepID=UPI002620F063|nr:protease complex subunit PrcB family protein [uncultured Flavobacterium sp.]
MKNLFLLLVSCIIVSCNNDEPETTPPFVPVTINPTLISKRNVGVSSSVGISEQKTIYNESTNWNLLLNQIDSYYLPLGEDYLAQHFIETNVDFTNFTVIAVFDQVYGGGGHSIDITNITEYESNIVVTVENLLTGNGSSVVTQPYHIVKIPKTTKPIVFE